MATLAIGDVHGQLGPLRALMRQVAATTRLVLVGDLVGRGPDSLAVLRCLADCGDRVVVTLGNHDLHLLWAYHGGHDPGADLMAVVEAHDAAELCEWLRGQCLAVNLPAAGAVVVHAGVWQGWDIKQVLELAREVEDALQGPHHPAALAALYGNEQVQWDPALRAGPRWQLTVNMLTRLRTCLPDGSMDLVYAGQPGEPPVHGAMAWFDLPGRSLADHLVICGHWSALGLLLRRDIAMLDTGCCFGGLLTGLLVEDRRLVLAR